MRFDDDEPIVATQIDDESGDFPIQKERTKARITCKSEAPLEKAKFKVMLEIMENESGDERLGVDFVTVLDCSTSIEGEKLEKMKIAMQLVIKKLSPIDRLSVVTFSSYANRLCPLRLMTENSQAEIEKLVNNLAARGGTNISAGLQMGLQVLEDRRLATGRVAAIMLLSDGAQGHQYKDAAQVSMGNVPVYTFGLGADYDPMVLCVIANKSRGGTFTDVQNEDNLSIAFSQCFDGLHSVVLRDVKVTFTPQNHVEIQSVFARNYSRYCPPSYHPQTVWLGDLRKKEQRKVIVYLRLLGVSPQVNWDVLQIKYTYSSGNEVSEGKPLFSSINRVKTSNERELEALETEEVNKTELLIKEAREMAERQKLYDAKAMIAGAQSWLEDNQSIEIERLKYELQEQKQYDAHEAMIAGTRSWLEDKQSIEIERLKYEPQEQKQYDAEAIFAGAQSSLEDKQSIEIERLKYELQEQKQYDAEAMIAGAQSWREDNQSIEIERLEYKQQEQKQYDAEAMFAGAHNWIEDEVDKYNQSIERLKYELQEQKQYDAETMIAGAHNWIEDEVNKCNHGIEDEVDKYNQSIERLKYELQQLLIFMETQNATVDLRRYFAKGPSSRTKVRIINMTEAPLEETIFKVTLKLMENESGNEKPKLDLVIVLDVSQSMEGAKMEKVKIAMQSMIKELSPYDTLSIITLTEQGEYVRPLRIMDEEFRDSIEDVVSKLKAEGPGNISNGLKMGLEVLNNGIDTGGRMFAIMLLSNADETFMFPDATWLEVGNVPIYTFFLGTNPKPLKSLVGYKSCGGTFTHVQNIDNLSGELSLCLARLLAVAVQDLKVTFTQVDFAIKNVYAGNHPQYRDDEASSVTVSFGNLNKKELHEVNVDLLLPDVSSIKCADILEISYTYSFGRELIHTNPRMVTITRRNCAPMINEAREVTDKQLVVANKMIIEAQKLLEKGVDETLNSEVQQLKRLMNSQKPYNEQESIEVTIDEIHITTPECGEGTIRSLEASTVDSNNDVKKIPIEFLLDRTGVRERIPESLNRSNNYEDWSAMVKKDLEELNLWKVMEEPPTEITESIENVDRRTAIQKLRQFRENWMALIFINQACGFPINLQIIDLDSANAAWGTLDTNWKKGGSHVQSFLSAVERGNWKNVECLLDSNRELATARIPSSQNTVLHLASLAGEVNIVKKLILLMEEKDLEIKDKDGYTALAKASIKGNKRIAQCMVEKYRHLVSIPTGTKLLPVVIAMMYGNKEMALYLYSATPKEVLTNKGNNNGSTLLTYSIRRQFYDICFDLIQKCPHLAVALDHNGQSALYQLARTPSAFRRGSKLNLWQKWIYNCLRVQDIDWNINETRLSVPDEDISQSNCWNAWCRGIWQQRVSGLLAVLGIKRIYEMKLVHRQSPILLDRICEQIKDDLDNDEINGIINALHEAATKGNVEFIVGVLKRFPELRWLRDKEGSTIFMKAVQFRQADVFGLIHEFPSEEKMVVLVDKRKENILHKLQYSSVDKISTIQGGLIKIQKEIKWLEEIKSMMPLDSLKKKNKEEKTAQELIDESHKRLIINAEKGMKETANSCIIVGILVVTIMFAAAFTVPGGNNQDSGLPLFLKKKLFKIFIISDAVSLSFSTVSVLMFLGILTSRYTENDFLKALPRKLIIAISTLFISLTAMMVAFTATLFIMLRKEFWISIPITVVLTSLPVILFALLFFRLLSECVRSTYGPSMFNRKSKLLLIG